MARAQYILCWHVTNTVRQSKANVLDLSKTYIQLFQHRIKISHINTKVYFIYK